MANHDIRRLLKTRHYRVTIFGSARIKPKDQDYKMIHYIARHLGKHGIDIITGGGPGLMEAANKGHQDGTMRIKDTVSVGIRIHLPFEQQSNKYLDVKSFHRLFSSRLDEFMKLSNAIIVAPGGIGTLLELFYCWQLMQVNNAPIRPIILLGKQWKGLIQWMKKDQLTRNLISKTDFSFIHVLKNEKKVAEIIDADYQKFLKNNPKPTPRPAQKSRPTHSSK